MFNGRLKITICGAKNFKATEFMNRFETITLGAVKKEPDLEPYVAIDVDEVAIERTSTKSKTKVRRNSLPLKWLCD